jgi:hypothetical protein
MTTRRALELAGLTLLFLAVRVMLLYARDPFYDELFTLWMARQPAANILPNLVHDSGPPLYYYLARFDSVVALRWLSLVFATMQFLLVAHRSIVAGALLALFPPAVLFAVDARSYALCALLVTIAILAWDGDRPWLAAFALVLAAYTHYYGVLFFPLLALRKKSWAALPLPFVLFAPGFFLASRQPAEAMAWTREPWWKPFTGLSTAGPYPESLFAPAPVALTIAAMLLFIAGVSRSRRLAAAALIPFAAAIAFAIAGRPVYFPMRFEAVLASTLVLWTASGLEKWERRQRLAIFAGLLASGAIAVALGILDHRSRPEDPYREAAGVLRRSVRAGEPVYATGYLYLETAVALGRPIEALPREQALHPGWRATGPIRDLPPGAFLWIVERNSKELADVGRQRTVLPLYMNERAAIVRVSPRA